MARARPARTCLTPSLSVGSGWPADELAGQVRAAAVQRLVECRQLWPGGADAAARLEAAVKALGGELPAPARESLYALGQRDRRAAVLRFCARG